MVGLSVRWVLLRGCGSSGIFPTCLQKIQILAAYVLHVHFILFYCTFQVVKVSLLNENNAQ